jgi:hypothetical protein
MPRPRGRAARSRYAAAMPDRKVTLRLLQRVCYDVLLRGPSAGEQSAYLGADLAAVTERLLASPEAMSAWFEEELYYFLLIDNFRPRGESIDRIPLRLSRGELTARDALAEILLSTGFTQRNPGNDTFVTVVLEQCLGYTVQDKKVKPVLEAGKKLYDGKKGLFLGSEGQNQADVIKIVLAHPDCARHLLRRHYRRLLDAELPKDAPEIAEVNKDWKRFFPVLGRWLQSDLYEQNLARRKPKSERQFLRGLYMDLLERVPTHDELRNLRNALQSMADPAPLKAVLAKLILDSGQAKLPELAPGGEAELAGECFRRYLAREPKPAEASAFASELQQGATPVQVVRTLVGSLEYQFY